MNLSSRPLSDDEFRLLGKGLKFCPKPKPHDAIKLAEETFKFSRRIRLKEFFAPDPEDIENNDSNMEEPEKRISDILRGFMPRFQNTITMYQRFLRWYFIIRAKAQCILNL